MGKGRGPGAVIVLEEHACPGGDKDVTHLFNILAELQIWRQPNLLVLSDEINNMN